MAQVTVAPGFVPANPTLWPQMLFGQPLDGARWPFSAPEVRYYYFARNGVWRAAKALGLDRGGEVLMPAYHHGVEVEALLDAGATVKFYRVGARWDVDVQDVASRISPKTRALYLIHYAGFPGPTAAMRELADRHQIPLIEDCALSLLSSDGPTPLGTLGDAAIYCLYKTLPVPNGGAMVLNRGRIAEPEPTAPPRASTFSHAVGSLLYNLELRGGRLGRWIAGAARGLGRGAFSAAGVERVGTGTQHFSRAHVHLGMSALARRIALRQDLGRIVEARRRNYFVLLARLRDVVPPLFNQLPPGVCPLFYPLAVPDKNELMVRLAARGVQTIDFWRHFHPGCEGAAFPEAATLRRTVLELPCHQDLTLERMASVADAVRECLKKPSRLRTAG